MEQLISYGAKPVSTSFMHPNEIKLRQLLRLELAPWIAYNTRD
jgi:hypothetical protein